MNLQSKEQDGKLYSDIVDLGSRAYNPGSTGNESKVARERFQELVRSAPTWPLMRNLLALIRPNVVPDWLQEELVRLLALCPMRPDGVRATLEVYFLTHADQKTGPGKFLDEADRSGTQITPDAISSAIRLFCKIPGSTTPTAWFAALGPQLLSMLDGYEGLDFTKIASHIICRVLSTRLFGAPGGIDAPAWVVFVDPILRAVNPPAGEQNALTPLDTNLPDAVHHVTGWGILVSAGDLAIALRRLVTLLLSSPYPALWRRILSRMLPQLWTLCSWPDPSTHIQGRYCLPARSLLETYFKITPSTPQVLELIHQLLCTGDSRGDLPYWNFVSTNDSDVQITLSEANSSPYTSDLMLRKAKAFTKLLTSAYSDHDLSSIFLSLFEGWTRRCEGNSLQPAPQSVTSSILMDPEPMKIGPILEDLILREMMQGSPEICISNIDRLVDFTFRLLTAQRDVDYGSDVVSVILSLLNLIITAPTFERSQVKPDTLQSIDSSLEKLTGSSHTETSATARNLALLLKYRDDCRDTNEPALQLSERQLEDRRTYSLAINYILQSDSPAPVRCEGLNLLAGLVQASSSALDVPAVLVLLSTLIKEDEDFLNLRVIKLYTLLASQHPRSTTEELIEGYVDAREKSTIDVRLRIGEALSQVIERLGETFTGEVSKNVCEVVLAMAGRRGRRPKTRARQARQQQKTAMKNKEAKDEWGGEVPDLSDDIPERERDRDAVLGAIVQGWESHLGAEDVRMRASALSIFSTAIETNISGVGPSLTSEAVDLCMNVLSLEHEPNTAILRRAAIVLILSFARALDLARESGQRLGFGLTASSRDNIVRTLTYLAGTDNDGLVREHAYDVIESLQNWSLARLTGEQPGEILGLPSLTGLNLLPKGHMAGRPRIEEVD